MKMQSTERRDNGTGRGPRRLVALALVMAMSSSGCVDEPDPSIAADNSAVIGGSAESGHPAVVMLRLDLGSGLYFLCSGALVGRRTVLTSGSCAQEHVDSPKMITVTFGSGQDDPNRVEVGVSDVVLERGFEIAEYNEGSPIARDIALLRLDSEAPAEIAALPIQTDSIDASIVGEPLRFVGFGFNDTEWGGGGEKRSALLTVGHLADQHLEAGGQQSTICWYDIGGPLIRTSDGGATVVGVASNPAMGCGGAGYFSRVDTFAEFVVVVTDAWEGPCMLDGECHSDCPRTPDPDCDICGFDGFCGSDCQTTDFDCPPDGAIGELCSDDFDCESRLCVAALDDARVEYCSRGCDPDLPAGEVCGSPLLACLMVDGDFTCRYPGTTPSAQGAGCDVGDDCRSGICDPDDGICVEPCGDGLPECAADYSCRSLDEQSVCRIPSAGGCRIGAARGAERNGGGQLVLLTLLALGAIVTLRASRVR